MLHYTYMEAIGKGFPGVYCHSFGDGSVYEEIIYDGGNPMPSKAEVDAWILDDIKDDMWELIKEERDRRKLEGGYKVTVSGTDYWFHSDTFSRTQQIGLVMMGASMPQPLMWKTMSGAFVQMTPTLALQVFQAAGTSDIAIFTVAEQKRAQMLASADPANFDYLSGWPKIYGE